MIQFFSFIICFVNRNSIGFGCGCGCGCAGAMIFVLGRKSTDKGTKGILPQNHDLSCITCSMIIAACFCQKELVATIETCMWGRTKNVSLLQMCYQDCVLKMNQAECMSRVPHNKQACLYWGRIWDEMKIQANTFMYHFASFNFSKPIVLNRKQNTNLIFESSLKHSNPSWFIAVRVYCTVSMLCGMMFFTDLTVNHLAAANSYHCQAAL